MSAPETPNVVEEKMEKLIRDLQEGRDYQQGYAWPTVDMSEVSPETRKTVLSVLGQRVQPRSSKDTTQTPPRERVRRELNLLAKESEYLPAKRAMESQAINDILGDNVKIVEAFLRDARRNDQSIEFEFPHSEWRIMHAISHIRGCMKRAEEVLKLSVDSDPTEEDFEAI
ncbi:hypothetical protein R3P38DRAFT_60740 [Favolaschia claudopus]|uniref:Uncharacterized protein n=1 Tax=Favolaschia claudopus TaxID=2862362 RepID=A0AAW0EJD7_9AGAR